jgi:hypothetical protein
MSARRAISATYPDDPKPWEFDERLVPCAVPGCKAIDTPDFLSLCSCDGTGLVCTWCGYSLNECDCERPGT